MTAGGDVVAADCSADGAVDVQADRARTGAASRTDRCFMEVPNIDDGA
jgi:hypothetical protein